VLIVVDPLDYPGLLDALDRTPTLGFRYELMRKAIAHTAAYDTAISATLATIDLQGDTFERREAARPVSPGTTVLAPRIDLVLDKIRDLRYGENPHQRAAWYRTVDVAHGFYVAQDAAHVTQDTASAAHDTSGVAQDTTG